MAQACYKAKLCGKAIVSRIDELVGKIRNLFGEDQSEESTKPKKFPCQLAFVLSCVGYSVGLGNVWQFPYLTYENGHDGGGAFLLIYLLLVMVVAVPLVILHLAVGQFTSSPVTVVFSRMKPYAKGLGWTMLACSVVTNVWYGHVSTWVEYYWFRSFSHHKDWAHCQQNLRPDCQCWDGRKEDKDAHLAAHIYFTKEVIHYALDAASCAFVNGSCQLSSTCFPNVACIQSNQSCTLKQDTSGPVSFQWHLGLCLIIFYVLVFLCLARGIKTGGRVVYFTATFPYLVLLMFLLPVTFLEGAATGRAFLLHLNWAQLLNYELWSSAARQAVFSMGTGYGVYITMASYSKFMNNFYRDAFIIVFANVSASLLSSLVTFQMVGHLSVRKGVGISELLSVDTGVAFPFVTCAAALNLEPLNHPIWSILFYSMLLMAAIDSQFGRVEGISWAIQNSFPKLKNFESRLIGAICFCQLLMGLPLCFSNTFKIFSAMYKSMSHVMLSCAIAQFLLVSYGYGWKNLFADIQMMLGYRYVFNKDWIEMVHGKCQLSKCQLVKDSETPQPCYHLIMRTKTSARTHCPTNKIMRTLRFVFGPTGEHVRVTWCYLGPGILTCLLILTIYETVSQNGDFHIYIFAAIPVIFGLFMSGYEILWGKTPDQYFGPEVSELPDWLPKEEEESIHFNVAPEYLTDETPGSNVAPECLTDERPSSSQIINTNEQTSVAETLPDTVEKKFVDLLAVLANNYPHKTSVELHEMIKKRV